MIKCHGQLIWLKKKNGLRQHRCKNLTEKQVSIYRIIIIINKEIGESYVGSAVKLSKKIEDLCIFKEKRPTYLGR